VTSDEHRQAVALESVANSLRQVVRVLTTMNENLVVAARDLEAMGKKAVFDPDNDIVLFTPRGWMNALQRWWEYEVEGNMADGLLTQSEFFDLMSRKGTEITTNPAPTKDAR